MLTGRRSLLESLEALRQARIGWVDRAISPFARIAHRENAEIEHIQPERAAAPIQLSDVSIQTPEEGALRLAS